MFRNFVLYVLFVFVAGCDDAVVSDADAGPRTCTVGRFTLEEGDEYPFPPVYVTVDYGRVVPSARRDDDGIALPFYVPDADVEAELGGDTVELRPVCGHEAMRIDFALDGETRIILRVPETVDSFDGTFTVEWEFEVCRANAVCSRNDLGLFLYPSTILENGVDIERVRLTALPILLPTK